MIITLVQANTLALFQVYGRNYLYGSFTSQINIGVFSPWLSFERLVILIFVPQNI